MYYDGTKILSMKDLNGNTPELYIVTTNRSGGKTTFFGRYFVKRFLNFAEKFCLMYRFSYEIGDCADKFFKEISSLFFPGYSMTAEKRAKGIYAELFLHKNNNDKYKISCGYAISLNSADQIKKYSHLFADVERILFDEFQSETNHYCDKEIEKFQSIHTSIARGGGKQSRYVPVFMLSNAVSLLNPYFSALGISNKLKKETKFLRGNGYILESGFIESAARSQENSIFNRAFSDSNYQKFSRENIYLNDNSAFIDSPDGIGKYFCTVKYENNYISLWEYPEQGIIFASDKYDITFPRKICVTTDDHNINYLMLKKNDMFIQSLRFYFERGCFRFKNLKCKDIVLSTISYK